MANEEYKQQLLSNVDEILKCVINGNTVEIKKNKDGLQFFEVSKKKFKKE